jgi:tetraacyldisaccharide 4'-kinase
MLARALPGVIVAVGPHRDVVGRSVEERFGPRVHLLDDGFQHLRLHRDLDVLCLDVGDLEDRPLPAGRLRESPAAARRADLVFLASPGAGEERMAAVEQELGRDRTFRVGRRGLGFFGPQGEVRPAPARPFLIAAIARPERFESDVRERCPEIAGRAFFPDHHFFSAAELTEATGRAQGAGADALVTTAKDAVRWPETSGGLPLLVFQITAEIQDEARLRVRLLASARRVA